MTKEELIRNLKYTMKKHKNDKLDTFGTDITQLCKDVLSVLEQDTQQVEPQEWISVKDRLPAKNDCYLVTFNFVSNGNPDNGIGVVEFYDGNFYSNGFGVNKDVVAWYINPVPSPYKGGDRWK